MTICATVEELGLRNAPAFYPPYPEFAAIAAMLLTVFVYLFLRERRDPNRRRWMVANLTLVVVFAVATRALVVIVPIPGFFIGLI